MSYYRTFLNRYNLFDGNIPGNDFQNPVSIEGVLGYNNAIQLTQPMHMQDLKYFRDPLYSYGDWVSSGETSKCTAFTDNPGNTANWNNTYEQYIAREGWNAYKVHGGQKAILRNFAKYAECDIKGQLAKYDANNNYLIAYSSGALTGNDADAVALAYYNSASQERTETAFWYSGARAAAEAYTLLGDLSKADEMNAIADNIRTAILTLLWDDGPINDGPGEPTGEIGRVPGRFGNAVRLGGDGPAYATMPANILAGVNDFTVATWVNPASTSTWSRIFDFGTGTTSNMFLTINAGSGPRFAITTGGGGAEQQINRTTPGQLPLNQWTHVAVTLSGNTGTLYINGQAAGTNTNMTLRPSSLGNTTQNWIGRSQYGDPTLNGIVDDFQIYNRALSAEEVAALGDAPGAGNVASYKADEANGPTLLDSSGNNRHATLPVVTVRQTGKVFKMRDVARNALVPWKDQQNFSPFTEGVVPNTDNYKLALRFYADKAEFPIMPSYTANQFDKAEAQAAGRGGTNNFSNINSTLQAQLYAKALRDYPSDYITPDMYRNLLEWVSWNEYVNGDNRYPDNNEYFFNWNPATQTLGRSGIHHNILGAYNFMIIDDIAGLRPRLDGAVELWPIDVGWDHYLVDNLSYHGSDLSIVWDKPGDDKRYYGSTPEGMSVYVEGRRAFTVDDIAHVRWDSSSGSVSVLDGSDTQVAYSTGRPLAGAEQTSLSDNARVVDMFQKAGTDLTRETGTLRNLAQGKPAQRLLHDHHAGAAGDRAGERGRRLHDQRPARAVGPELPRPQSHLGHAGLAQRAGLARARPRRADPLRHGEAVLLRQQAVRVGRQHLPHAVGLHRAGTQRHRLGRRARPEQEPGRAAGQLQQGHLPGRDGAAHARPADPHRDARDRRQGAPALRHRLADPGPGRCRRHRARRRCRSPWARRRASGRSPRAWRASTRRARPRT